MSGAPAIGRGEVLAEAGSQVPHTTGCRKSADGDGTESDQDGCRTPRTLSSELANARQSDDREQDELSRDPNLTIGPQGR